MISSAFAQSQTPAPAFGPSNPFYAPSTLPFHAPPFDKIKDSDYQPAIEAGMAEQLTEMGAIADNPAPPTFENTLVAMEKSGQLLHRASAAFDGVTGANTNPTLQKAEEALAPKLAAHSDAIYLDSRSSPASRPSTISANPCISIPNRSACSKLSTKSSSTPEPTSPTPTRQSSGSSTKRSRRSRTPSRTNFSLPRETLLSSPPTSPPSQA